MLNKIHIENFQSHKNTELDLHPGINVFVGPSDNGKTAVLRSMLWVINNNPSGTNHVSDWIKEKTKKGNTKIIGDTRVTIIKDDDEITRIRNNDINGYEINGKVLEAIRTEVPEQVNDILNISDVNIQQQMDSPFLLSESGSEIARFFNKLVRLDVIDLYLSSVDSKKRETIKDLKYEESELLTIMDSIEKFNWLPAVKNLINKYEIINVKTEEKQHKYDSLQAQLSEHYIKQNIIKENGIALSFESLVKRYLKEHDKNSVKKTDKIELQNQIQQQQRFTLIIEALSGIEKIPLLITKYNTFSNRQKENQKNLTSLNSSIEEFQKASTELSQIGDIKEVGNFIKDAEKIQSDKLEKENKLSDLRSQINIYDLKKQEVQKTSKTIEELSAQLPDICPTCGQPMEENNG